MSTNFADAPAGDAAKGAKIFKTKYVLFSHAIKNRVLDSDVSICMM